MRRKKFKIVDFSKKAQILLSYKTDNHYSEERGEQKAVIAAITFTNIEYNAALHSVLESFWPHNRYCVVVCIFIFFQFYFNF